MNKALALLLMVPLFAGCIGGDDPLNGGSDIDDLIESMGTDWAQAALIGSNTDETHDHRDWTQHTGMSTPNFEKLAHNDLASAQFGDATAGGFFCGGATTTEDGRRLSVIESFDTNVAFIVIDVTDPLAPTPLGEFRLDFAQTYDIDITPDGQHVVIAANAPTGQQPAPGAAAIGMDDVRLSGATVTGRTGFANYCTGETSYGPEQTFAAGPSTIMVGIQDPTAPVFESLVPEPILGPHSISTADIDGTTYVVSSITNLVHQASYFHFFQVVDSPLGSQLVHVSIVDSGTIGDPATRAEPPSSTDPDVLTSQGANAALGSLNGHVDAEIAEHPITGQPLVYVSNWNGGLAVLDFTIPQAPVPIGAWADPLPQGGAIHSTLSIPGEHDGRHYLLAGQEFTAHPVNRPSGWIYILDDTDPANIVEVGRWTLPVDVQLVDWNGELFSTHYFRVVDETVFVAMYHGGVWAFQLDLENPENMALPPSVGVFVPDEGPTNGRDPTGFYDYAPFVLDMFAFDDYNLVVYDGLSGVYSVQYDPEHPMQSPEAWPREGIEY